MGFTAFIPTGTFLMPAVFQPFRIDWNTASRSRWDALYAHCHRPSILQSSSYALALAATEGMRADCGMIYFENKPIGLVQVQVKPLLKLLSICRLYRGPAWIYESIPPRMHQLVLSILRQRYRLRHGRGFVFHPELSDTQNNRQQLRESGFRQRFPGYQTLWLDLRPPLKTIRSQMKGKWRHALTQAERANLTCEMPESGPVFDQVIAAYDTDKQTKGYRGPGPAFLHHLKSQAQGCNDLWLLAARQPDQSDNTAPIAGIIIARHGQAATYVAAWSGVHGRRSRAHHWLLWQAVQHLRNNGVEWFDLGGLNPQTADGVTAFKRGLGGSPDHLVGGYV